MFCAMLGTVAGNLALTGGARRRLYRRRHRAEARVALRRSAFRERFEAKGRMQPYLAAIPTYVITHGCRPFSAAPPSWPSRRARSA